MRREFQQRTVPAPGSLRVRGRRKTIGETPINCLRKRFAAFGGTQKLSYRIDMSRFLRSIRLASHLAQAN